MSPQVLAKLKACRNGMAIAGMGHGDRFTWIYGTHPLGHDYLRQFKMMQQVEREWDKEFYDA